MRKGFTLIECMLAGSILSLTALVLFEGVIVSTRIAHENADLLAAEAVAWDAVWKRFNEDFANLALGEVTETLTEKQAPQLTKYDMAPVLKVSVKETDVANFSSSVTAMVRISADVEWGPRGNRRKLSDMSEDRTDHYIKVFRGNLGRAY